jgi:hypothetical protein
VSRLIARLLQWIAGKLGLLVVIVAILLVGSWLKAEWDEHRRVQAALGQQEALLEGLRADLAGLDEAIAADQAEWRRRTADRMRALWRELDEIDADVADLGRRATAARGEYLDLARQAQAARRIANQSKAKLDALERGYWWWDSYLNPGKLVELKSARAMHAALDRTARAAEAARSRASAVVVSYRRQVEQLELRRSGLLQVIEDPAHAASPQHRALVASKDRKQAEIVAVERVLDTQRAQLERDPRERLIATIKAKIPLALGILAGILLLPVLIKALFYFVLAPLAGRLAPVRILPAAEPPPFPQPPQSRVSATLEIARGDELLVQPDFLQSSSQPAVKRTRWFLNPRLPFASIASGMFALTSVRPEGEVPTRVVVSSQRDPFSEIGTIAIPDGAAMVLQPRSLAGIVKPAGRPTRITRHWRLASLHAWLTLQLRYLVFHGPCTVLLKGCRGVRSEAPLPEQPRLINQSATLGFSANLEYRTIRCETFVPYLRGQEALFNDLFAGGPGWFVYEEMPAREGRYGVAGRGLEGLADAFLKAFGI